MNDGILTLPHVTRVGAAPAAPAGAIGKVASPPHRESTSEEFYFWVAPKTLVEKSQIVRTESKVGEKHLVFYGLIREVYHQSRQSDLGEEFDRYDGDVAYQPPFDSAGFTYAAVTILRTEPAVMTPPMEGSDVYLGGEREAFMAYGADEIENPLAVGLVKNGGGSGHIGPGRIDLDYLLGANGGHLNVNGVAGRGTKSSLLLHFNYLLLHEARRQKRLRASDTNRLRIVPIILNVKNFDLFHIDRRSARFDPGKEAEKWHVLGIDAPGPFQNVTFYAPQQANLTVAVKTGRPKEDVQPYSWSLKDIIERGLLLYLFAEDDRQEANFGALVHDLDGWLTEERTERDGSHVRQLARHAARPQTFDELLKEIRSWTEGATGTPFSSKQHHPGTIRKLYRRLFLILSEGQGVLRRHDQQGKPLTVTALDTCDPKVIDLSSLAGVPSLQRFVAATIFNQLKEERTGAKAQRGLIYLVTLDELNRFAPRDSHDPITALIEHVAAEMRSQGIILLGAQQQASLVSGRVIENAGIRVLGKSGSMELGHAVWRFLSDSARRKASMLLPTEKLLMQDSFREPMLVEIPFPPWALREAETVPDVLAAGTTEFDDP